MNAVSSAASSAERYRIKAAEMRAKARDERRPELSAEFERLAAAYLRLAEQADRNSATDIVYEPGARQTQQQQQQQQAPPAKKPEK